MSGRSRAGRGAVGRVLPPATSLLPGARAAALARFVAPELATLVTEPPEGDEWLHEMKFDGYRILARIEGGAARLLSRNDKDWTDRFGAVARAASQLPVRDALLDGEVAVVQPDGTTSFNALQNALEGGPGAALTYFVFDLLHLDGADVRAAPLESRKAALARLLGPRPPDGLRYSEHVIGGGLRFLEAACRLGLEGIICKRRDAVYVSGRGRDWLKVKCLREQELVIGGFTDPEGARQGLGALLLGVYEGRELRYAGKVGTGFSVQGARKLRAALDRLRQDACPFFPEPVGLGRPHWVKPLMVAQVAFSEWTPDGRLRHPSFKGIREDKNAREVVREQPQGQGTGQMRDVDVAGVSPAGDASSASQSGTLAPPSPFARSRRSVRAGSPSRPGSPARFSMAAPPGATARPGVGARPGTPPPGTREANPTSSSARGRHPTRDRQSGQPFTARRPAVGRRRPSRRPPAL